MPTLLERASRLGISSRELAKSTGVSRGAVDRAFKGEPIRAATYGVLDAFLSEIEDESGDDPIAR